MTLVSGCLSGDNPSYDGSIKINEKIREPVRNKQAIPICPELLGGLPVPRKRSEIACGCGQIYDGTFNNRLIKGDGVACALLKTNGIELTDENG
jgi:uncharacterized protein YbbK (DUF523 family)